MADEIKIQDAGTADKVKLGLAVLIVIAGVAGYYALAADAAWMRWRGAHADWNCEHRVAASLEGRSQRAGLEGRFGEILVPTEEVVEMRAGQKRKSERKFYPGYVLVQMEMDEETWHLVRDVPKVLGFIGGTPEKPAAITDKEANQILRRVEEGVDKPRPK